MSADEFTDRLVGMLSNLPTRFTVCLRLRLPGSAMQI